MDVAEQMNCSDGAERGDGRHLVGGVARSEEIWIGDGGYNHNDDIITTTISSSIIEKLFCLLTGRIAHKFSLDMKYELCDYS